MRHCSISNVCCWTDSNGVVAIHEADFPGKRVFFSTESEGYRYERNVLGTTGSIINVLPRKMLTPQDSTSQPLRTSFPQSSGCAAG